MSFLALLFALLIEQARPLGERNPIHDAMGRYARWVQRTLDAGQQGHALSTWLLCVMALPYSEDPRHIAASADIFETLDLPPEFAIGLGQEALLQRDGDSLGEADADEARGGDRVAIADQCCRLCSRHKF